MKNFFNKTNFKIDHSGNSIAIFPKNKYFKVSSVLINHLIKFSKTNDNCNVRICLHKDKRDRIQNMIVLLNKKNKTKFLVHKHFLKDEIYQIIHGILKIDIYKNNGVFKKIVLKKGKDFIIRLKKNEFHKVYPKQQIAIFHEIRLGPFKKNDSIFL